MNKHLKIDKLLSRETVKTTLLPLADQPRGKQLPQQGVRTQLKF
jgi:hypothetical protein